MPEKIDFKTFIAVASLFAAGITGVNSIRSDINAANASIVSVREDVADIRRTQLSSGDRIQKLYDLIIGDRVGELRK